MMKTSFPLIFISLTLHQITALTMKEMDSLQIYYDDDDQPVPMLTNISEVVPTLKTPSLRFGPLPCSCQDLTCGCCANMNIQFLDFNRRGCTNFTYDPYEFSIGMNMLWNEESVYQTSISGKNPPPICVQAPLPGPYFPTMDQCVRMFNIFTPGRNLHMCMNLETRIERVPVLVLQFDCMRMGLDGVALLKPDEMGGLKPPQETGGKPAGNKPSTEIVQQAADVFDSVDQDKKKINSTIKGNYTFDETNLTNKTMETVPENINLTLVNATNINKQSYNISETTVTSNISKGGNALPLKNTTTVHENHTEKKNELDKHNFQITTAKTKSNIPTINLNQSIDRFSTKNKIETQIDIPEENSTRKNNDMKTNTFHETATKLLAN